MGQLGLALDGGGTFARGSGSRVVLSLPGKGQGLLPLLLWRRPVGACSPSSHGTDARIPNSRSCERHRPGATLVRPPSRTGAFSRSGIIAPSPHRTPRSGAICRTSPTFRANFSWRRRRLRPFPETRRARSFAGTRYGRSSSVKQPAGALGRQGSSSGPPVGGSPTATCRGAPQTGRTFWASSPLRPGPTSNSTR